MKQNKYNDNNYTYSKNHIIYHCISNYIYIEPFNYLISIIVGRRINPAFNTYTML